MTPDEVIELDPKAQHFYDKKDAICTENNLKDEFDLYNAEPTNIYIPPFELLITNVGYGMGTTQVTTRAVSIKMNVAHGNSYTNYYCIWPPIALIIWS